MVSFGSRDFGINHIKTRKNHTCYGMGLGIMVLDDPYPGFPGDVRNASAFPKGCDTLLQPSEKELKNMPITSKELKFTVAIPGG